ncbi:hypothetical protein MLD38_023303 [Melastoma candidum]|uniref:Uncharacterized protein n=1 Tax=Melastoma candidum TaxID=119954 RepID=A0ACB9QMM3_9MYRT|nr:hypothetical protein MLD38_023303 [Melastoma candidum]
MHSPGLRPAVKNAFLVKHVSRLEKEVEEPRTEGCCDKKVIGTDEAGWQGKTGGFSKAGGGDGTDQAGLGNILVKPVHTQEREKMKQLNVNWRLRICEAKQEITDNCDSLDKVMVRHVPRLERDNMGSSLKEEFIPKAKGGAANVDSQGEQARGSRPDLSQA